MSSTTIIAPLKRKVKATATPFLTLKDRKGIPADAPRVVDGVTYYSLNTALGRLPKDALAVRFVDDRGRNCAAVLEPLGRGRGVYGWEALVIVDDGTYVGSPYVGKLAYTKPTSIEVIGSFLGVPIPTGYLTTDEMRDALIVRAKDVADMMTLPQPVPAYFGSDWK